MTPDQLPDIDPTALQNRPAERRRVEAGPLQVPRTAASAAQTEAARVHAAGQLEFHRAAATAAASSATDAAGK